jgi:hypothetical protein
MRGGCDKCGDLSCANGEKCFKKRTNFSWSSYAQQNSALQPTPGAPRGDNGENPSNSVSKKFEEAGINQHGTFFDTENPDGWESDNEPPYK